MSVKSLEQICCDSIAESVAYAPEILQEIIYKKSKTTYKQSIRNQIKDELKQELKIEIMEELLEEYLNIIPTLFEEALELVYTGISADNVFNVMNQNSFNIDPEILQLSVDCVKITDQHFRIVS